MPLPYPAQTLKAVQTRRWKGEAMRFLSMSVFVFGLMLVGFAGLSG